MRVTKYPQSCLLVETDGVRLLVDPGDVALEVQPVGRFGRLDAVLYTHRHADHLDERGADHLRDAGVPLHGNADVAALLGEGVVEVRDGEAFDVGGLAITPRDLPHVEMVDGSAGPPNTGYLIGERLFHPGDGIHLDGLSVEALAVPIAGPSVSFRDAYRFVEEVSPRTVLPIHYDTFIADPHRFAGFCDLAEIAVLEPGQALTLD